MDITSYTFDSAFFPKYRVTAHQHDLLYHGCRLVWSGAAHSLRLFGSHSTRSFTCFLLTKQTSLPPLCSASVIQRLFFLPALLVLRHSESSSIAHSCCECYFDCCFNITHPAGQLPDGAHHCLNPASFSSTFELILLFFGGVFCFPQNLEDVISVSSSGQVNSLISPAQSLLSCYKTMKELH